jgi:hypothetical protein
LISTIHEDLISENDIWRLVTEQIATLESLEKFWSIDDVSRAIATLGIKSEIEAIYGEAMKIK